MLYTLIERHGKVTNRLGTVVDYGSMLIYDQATFRGALVIRAGKIRTQLLLLPAARVRTIINSGGTRDTETYLEEKAFLARFCKTPAKHYSQYFKDMGPMRTRYTNVKAGEVTGHEIVECLPAEKKSALYDQLARSFEASSVEKEIAKQKEVVLAARSSFYSADEDTGMF